MSAPPEATNAVQSHAPAVAVSSEPVVTTPASVNGEATRHVTPLETGIAGAALGLGAGLVVAELLVPGLVLGAIAIVGLATANRVPRFISRLRRLWKGS
jgi:hypothetical protein